MSSYHSDAKTDVEHPQALGGHPVQEKTGSFFHYD